MVRRFIPTTFDSRKLLYWLAIYVALIGGNYMFYQLVLPIRIGFHVVAALAIVFFLYKQGLPDSPMTPAALLMAMAIVLSIPLAIDSRMALENGWSWIVNLLALLCLIQLCRMDYGETLLRAHFAAGAIVAIFALVEFGITHLRPAGIFANINMTGAYVAALFVPAIHAARETTGRSRLQAWSLVALLGLTILIGDNRGALLSAGVASLAYITFTWHRSHLLKLGLWLGAGAVLLALVWAISLKPYHADGDVERLDLWQASTQMIQNFTFGVGPGLFAQQYRLIGTVGQNRFADAHNHYLTLGAELGVPGLAAGAVMFLVGVYYLIGLKLNRSQLAALAALIGIAAHMMVDSYPAENWALLVGLYVAYVLKDAYFTFHPRLIRIMSAWAALALTAWTIRMVQFDRAQILYETALNTGRYYDAYDATQLDPDMKLYQIELKRLGGEDISHLDSNLALYGLTMYGRVFK